ncbi:TonB-dependent receptor domain-containing protein [Marinibactrum halimedae]|uniref:TonB-dependent receptor n=1 Tax=Marinibactrum halimedae TaxID=1444977 RepID=A0AA37TAD4_9GAMM|nr:TonB-dependent receptor [Marinibactrum halimedae]MCD9460322.1 TonB-dependent receptor [Marinibactrum halimedae]GLS26756.1 TonB-dependent receptor [Marinibactrum halimedae]
MIPYRVFKRLPLASLASLMAFSAVSIAETKDASLEEVVVTATRTAQSVMEAPASVSVISQEQIEALSADTLNDIVSQSVGVESTKQEGRAGREFIKLRGMDSGFTLILLNGRRMSSSNAVIRGNDFDYNTIPTSSIERIEIIRGPMSSLYGSEALGGVINIITKKADNDWAGTVNTNVSSPEEDGGEHYQLGMNTAGALVEDELFLNLSLNVSNRDAWQPFEENDESGRDRSDVTGLENRDSYSLLSSLSWQINDQHSLALDMAHSNDERSGIFETVSRSSPFEATVERNSVSITHNGKWDLLDSQVRFSVETVDVEEGIRRVAEITEENQILDAVFTNAWGPHRITYGGEVRSTELDSERDLLETGKASVDQSAVFIQDEWSLADGLTLTVGGRMDNHEEFGSHVSPRVYLVNRLNDQWVIKGGLGRAFRAPSLLRLNEEYRLSSCRGSCYVIGNPDLSPETSDNYEFSTLYQSEYWSGELTFFLNDVDDLIQRDRNTVLGEQEGRDVFTYQNIASAKIEGIEFAVKGNLTDRLHINTTYTYLDAKDEATGNTLLERPEHSFMTRVALTFSQSLNSFVQYNYTGEQAIRNNDILDAFSTIDIGLNSEWSDSVRLRVGIRNLTNKELDRDASLNGYNEAPRSGYVGVSVDF